MRTADDLSTEGPTLPAPSGLPAPAGQHPAPVPVHLPNNPLTAPRLPPRPVRNPTGQVPALNTTSLPTTAAAAAFATLTGMVPVVNADGEPVKKRRSKKWIALPVVLIILGAAGFVLRDSSLAHRITGKGYDHNALPVHSFPQPKVSTVELTYTVQTVGIDQGLPTNFWEISRALINFEAKAAKVSIDEAKATILGGTIGTAQSTGPSQDVVIDEQNSYVPGAAPADPWTRRAHEPGQNVSLLSRNELRMYQDVVDPALRAMTPSKVLTEVRHEVPVTTYEYTFPFGEFYEAAPRLFDFAQILDGNAADDAPVTVTLSFDADWVVRFVEVNVDYHSVVEHSAQAHPDDRFPYRISVDVVSTSDQPKAVEIPTNTVDGGVSPADTVVP